MDSWRQRLISVFTRRFNVEWKRDRDREREREMLPKFSSGILACVFAIVSTAEADGPPCVKVRACSNRYTYSHREQLLILIRWSRVYCQIQTERLRAFLRRTAPTQEFHDTIMHDTPYILPFLQCTYALNLNDSSLSIISKSWEG